MAHATSDLREWIDRAEEVGLLKRIQAEVDWDEEMAAITYTAHREEGAPALLFENVRGYPTGYRVLFNMFSSSAARLALTMNENITLSEQALIQVARDRFGERIEPVYVDTEEAPIYQNTDRGDDVDLYKFPAPKMWPKDGGRYIGTANATICRNTEEGVINVGTYRQMIHSKNTVGLYTSPGKDLRLEMKRRWARGEPLEVAAVYGAPPELYLVAGLPFDKDESEYDYAGGIRGAPIEVVEGEVTGLPIPAHADIVVEGKLYPNDVKLEGPFGEFTGYYGRPVDDTPVFTIEAVHYRDDPILTAALMADYPGCDINLSYSIGRSAGIWNDLNKLGIPGVKGVYAHPAAASGFGMTVVSIEQQYAGHASQVATLAAQCPSGAYYSKVIVVVDEDVDPTDINQVLWAMATRFSPKKDIDILNNTWSTWLDPTLNPPEERPYGSKMLIDATKDHKYYEQFAERSAVREDVYRQIVDRWNELGLAGAPSELPMFAEDAKGAILENSTGAATM